MNAMTSLYRLVLLILVFLLSACATVNPHDPYAAAVADVITTEAALAHGARELNPIGTSGAYILKGIYLYVYRQGLELPARKENDRRISSLWWGASANNLVQLALPGVGWVSLIVGGMVGWEIYSYAQSREVEQGQLGAKTDAH